MIGYLRGLIRRIEPTNIILDVNGVGYEVNLPTSALQNLPVEGEIAELYTHLHVREDVQALFGFTQIAERDLFRTLITISKVGPRIALAILSELSVSELVVCVQMNDTRPLEKVPGIGAKTAEKLLIELRDKVSQFPIDVSIDMDDGTSTGNSIVEATEALVELGFSNREARQAVLIARDKGKDTTEQLVREALTTLSTVLA